MIDESKAHYRSMLILRADAVSRGLQELAIAYGWSAISAGERILQEKIDANRNKPAPANSRPHNPARLA